MQLFTELGLDTGFINPENCIDQNAHAGMEKDIREEDAPYIIKNPRLCDYLDEAIEKNGIIIDHAIIPMRDLYSAAQSRRETVKRDNKGLPPYHVLGGLWDTSNPEEQEIILSIKFYQLMHTISKHQIPVTFLHYPFFILQPEHLYNKIFSIFRDIDHSEFLKAFEKISKPELINTYRPEETLSVAEIESFNSSVSLVINKNFDQERNILQIKAELTKTQTQLAETQTQLAETQTQLAESQTQLAEIHRSKAWQAAMIGRSLSRKLAPPRGTVRNILEFKKPNSSTHQDLCFLSSKRKLKVGIIIVSFNSSNAVRLTLASLAKAKNYTQYELFLIDNNSKYREWVNIHRAFKRHKRRKSLPWNILRLEKNHGFSGGNNIGIKKFLNDASITHICLLNSDVLVSDFWLDKLIDFDVDVITPVTNRADSSQKIPIPFDINLLDCLDKKRETIKSYASNLVDNFSENWYLAWKGNKYEVKQETTFFCVLFSKKVIEIVGLLDDHFFPGGYEDTDYCLRIHAKGIKIWHARDSFIFHFGSASFGRLSKAYFEDVSKNNKEFLERKHGIKLNSNYGSPFMSFCEDLCSFYSYKDDNPLQHSLQRKFLYSHTNTLSTFLAHVCQENISLRALLLEKTANNVRNASLNLQDDGRRSELIKKWQSVLDLITRHEQTSNRDYILRSVKIVNEIAVIVNRLVIENVIILFSTSNNNKKTPLKFRDFLHLSKRLISSFVCLRGIVFFGGYPYHERLNDGYFQRVGHVDSIFAKYYRIYIDNYVLPYRLHWYDKPAPKTLVIRLGGGWKRKLVTKLIILIAILRCRVVYFHSILSIGRKYNLLRLPFIKSIIDIHGVVPEEFLYHNDFNNYIKYNKIESIAFSKATCLIAVSGRMIEYFKEKYSQKLNDKFINIPIFTEIKSNRFNNSFNGKRVVIYAGGLQKWQQIPKMINAIEKTIQDYQFKVYCPNPSDFIMMLPKGIKKHPNLEVGSKSHIQVMDTLEHCHFGFILREDCIVNKVACPTKLLEYIGTGVIPIMEYPLIGDFVDLGMRFISLSDFIKGNIPDDIALEAMRKKNFCVYKDVRENYQVGIQSMMKKILSKVY